MGIEVVGGLLSGSLALLADAGHMLTDTAALALAWIAAHLTRRPTSSRRSYGYHRAQVLAAFVNALALFGVASWICIEAAHRIAHPQPIAGDTMLAVAIAGMAANVAVYFVLGEGSETNLNVAAARLHVLGDLLGSVAATTAALVIIGTGWTPIDPILSVLVAVLILRSAWVLLLKSTRILMEDAPDSVDPDVLRKYADGECAGYSRRARRALLVPHDGTDDVDAARGLERRCAAGGRAAFRQARTGRALRDHAFGAATRARRMPG